MNLNVFAWRTDQGTADQRHGASVALMTPQYNRRQPQHSCHSHLGDPHGGVDI